MNTYTLVATRQRAEGRRQRGRKKVAREKGIISDYPNLILVNLSAIALLQVSLMLVATEARAQFFPREFDGIGFEPQLDIPLNNGSRGETRDQADLLLRLGGQSYQKGYFDKSLNYWLQALEIYRQVGDLQGLGLTYDYLGQVYAKLGDYEEAAAMLRRRLGVARTLKDFQGQIYGLNNLGTLLLQTGNNQAAAQSL
ncbi:MAG: tetratricopeptide repeat protein, partial [Symploca sp. SIO1B1]|nr:tetratricopeptide repeat protein [Symploca sp. SIO1B1]